MKQCSKCKKNKELTSFHNNKRMKDGKCPVCKICVSLGEKTRRLKPKEKLDIDLRGGVLTKGEYCMMWNFLSSMGYNITENIHEQFCEKYNLPTKVKPASKVKFCFSDCFSNEQ
jgi:hypothetical protein